MYEKELKGILMWDKEPQQERGIEEKLVKHLVDRFCGWHLPKDFHPDGGIMFMDVYDNGTEQGGKFEPVGTNLFTADQAKEMFRFLLEHEDGRPILAELFHQELQKAREDIKRDLNYIHYNLRNAIRNERDGLNVKGYEGEVDKWLGELAKATHSELDQEKEEAIAKARDQEAKLWFETWYSHYISPTKPLTGEFAKFATERIQMTGYERDQALPTEDNK